MMPAMIKKMTLKSDGAPSWPRAGCRTWRPGVRTACSPPIDRLEEAEAAHRQQKVEKVELVMGLAGERRIGQVEEDQHRDEDHVGQVRGQRQRLDLVDRDHAEEKEVGLRAVEKEIEQKEGEDRRRGQAVQKPDPQRQRDGEDRSG